MNVVILNVLNQNGKNFRSEGGRQFLVNVGRITSPVANGTSLVESQINYIKMINETNYIEKWIVADGITSINQTIAGIYNQNAVITLTPNFIAGKANSGAKSININQIAMAVMNGTTAQLYVQDPTRQFLIEWKFTSTSLITLAKTINQATSNQLYTVTFGACTTSTQAVTYDISQAGTLILERFNGSSYVTIDTYSASAGSGSRTFSFNPGDLISGNLMRVSLVVSSQTQPIAESTFSCTGGSGSGSGITGDCNMYAYFDGNGWNDTLNTLNWGASCTTGYVLQVSSQNDNFANPEFYVVNTTTEDTIIELELTAGTYYARVRNVEGQTRFSPTLTFTAS